VPLPELLLVLTHRFFFFFSSFFSILSAFAGVASCADSSPRKRRVFSVAWGFDGTVASGSEDKTIKLWTSKVDV
jgi:hypothetical protein